MSDDAPQFSRKARNRLSREERARLIAEITGSVPSSDAADRPPATPSEPPEAEPETAATQMPAVEPEDLWATLPAADLAADAFDDVDDDDDEQPDDDVYADDQGGEHGHADDGHDLLDGTSDPAAIPEAAPRIAPEPELPPAFTPSPEMLVRQAYEPEIAVPPEPEPDRAPAPSPAPSTRQAWARLTSIPIDAAHLERNLIITASRHDPAHGAFDVLRTRLVQTLLEHDWKRVAITSPSRDCGKTFTAVNLAISLSRYEATRTVLMDMDMRNPSVATVLGATDPGSMGDFLQGLAPTETHFKRVGRNALNIGANLAVAMNDRVEPYAAELLQDPNAEEALERMMAELDPDVVLYDLPPALAFDDVIAFKAHYDGVLMVVGGGTTTADEIREVMRRLGENVPLLGVVLNQAESEDGKGFTYGY